MKCLVVATHPLNDSLCKQLAEKVVGWLQAAGHDVVVGDLYAQKFDPVLSVAERGSYYSASYEQSQVKDYVKRLQEAEALVLLFPTWWFSMPAMLKGWFDRVWGPGIAYDHASDMKSITPRLNNLKKVLVVTTLGAPRWVDWLVLRQPVKRTLKHAILETCAKNSKLEFFSLYDSESLDEQKIEKFKDRIEKALKNWR